MRRLIREECALRDNHAKLPEKKQRIKTLNDEAEGLKKQLPEAASPEEARIQKELQERRTALAAAQQASALHKQAVQKIADIRSRLAGFTQQSDRFYREITGLLRQAGVPAAKWGKFRPTLVGTPEPALSHREADLRRLIAERDGAVDNPAEGTIRWLQ